MNKINLISTYIATIIILVITIGIGAILYFYFSGYISKLTSETEETTIKSIAECSKARIDSYAYSYAYKDFKYRIPITIKENSGNNLNDYQILITLDTASLIFQGKMRSDCGDIRFTDSDGITLLNYWIEPNTCNTNNTKIWVKVPNIPANSNKIIYLYYGNPSANSMSNPQTVFYLFDVYPSYPGWSDNRTSMCGSQGLMGGYNLFGSGAYTQKTIDLPAGTYMISFIFAKIDSWDGEYGRLFLNDNLVWNKSYWGSQGAQICGRTDSGWNELFDNISVSFTHQGGSLTIKFDSTLNQAANDESWGVDRIIIRKYTSPEPTISLGNEESSPIIKLTMINLGIDLGKKYLIKLIYEDEKIITRNITLDKNLNSGETKEIYLTDLPKGIIKKIEIYCIDVCPNMLVGIRSVNIEV